MKKMLGFIITGISIGAILAFISAVSIADAATSAEKLRGKILLQVQQKGEAWYVRPDTGARVSLGRPADAFSVMRSLGLGVTNANLNKIPRGLTAQEQARLEKQNSDGDPYDDATEILSNYNPLGKGKMPIDFGFTGKMSGKILLQVESKGEAWYVDPTSLRRYFLGRPADAFSVMHSLGLGVSNSNVAEIPIDTAPQPSVSKQPKLLSSSHAAFGVDIMKLLAQEEAGKNIVISPPSIALALSMVYNGAVGETQEEMRKALHFQNLDISTVNQESSRLIESLKNPDPNVELSEAVRKGLVWTQSTNHKMGHSEVNHSFATFRIEFVIFT